jgi:hypothetical protein
VKEAGGNRGRNATGKTTAAMVQPGGISIMKLKGKGAMAAGGDVF